MRTELYWIDGPWPGRLAISPRPRGGDWLCDEVRAWSQAGIQTVVSLLTAEEAAELVLGDEAAASRAQDVEFVSFPVIDRGVPSSRQAYLNLLSELTNRLADGRTVLVHSRQGIGRAALIAIGLLLASGVGAEAAIAGVEKARGQTVPETAEQRRWLEEHAKAPFIQAA